MVEFPDDIKRIYKIKETYKPEMTVKNNIQIIKIESTKMNEEYYRYSISDDDFLRDTILNSLCNRFNRYTQAFKDIVAFIKIYENETVESESLGYFIRVFKEKDIKLSLDGNEVLNFICQRNAILNDYFNSAKLYNDLAKNIATYGKGYIEIANSIENYFIASYPQIVMEENIKKTVKNRKL